MAEVSNKTLAFLLVGAIVISLGGTLLSLNRLSSMGAVGVTGAATTGNISLVISVDTTFNVTNTNIDFGSGGITGINTWAVLDSDYSNNIQWSGPEVDSFLTVQNDGNVPLNVTMTANYNATDFIGGTNPELNYTIWDNELHSCTIAMNTGLNEVNSTAAPMKVCESLAIGGAGNDFNDTINLSVRLYIPIDASQTSENVTFTFAATEALSS